MVKKMLKYLCLTVLGFCVGFGTCEVFASDPNNDDIILSMNMISTNSNDHPPQYSCSFPRVIRTLHMNYPSENNVLINQFGCNTKVLKSS